MLQIIILSLFIFTNFSLADENLEEVQDDLMGLTDKLFTYGGTHGRCNHFIDKEGNYGQWGEFVVERLRDEGTDSIFYLDDLEAMTSVCKRWPEFDQLEKEHYWVWVIASIAWDESKCGERRWMDHSGLVGLLQMEKNLSDRKWRGKNCREADLIDHRNNIRCSFDIMAELLKGKEGIYKSNGLLYQNPNSYWEKLRRVNGGTIGARMRTYTPCESAQ